MEQIEHCSIDSKEPRCAKEAARVCILGTMAGELGIRPEAPIEPGAYFDILCTQENCRVIERFFPDGPTSYSFSKDNDPTNALDTPVCIASSGQSLARLDIEIQNLAVELDAHRRTIR